MSETVRRFVVGEEHLARRVGSGTLPVLSTPSLLAMLEQTAMEALVPRHGPDLCSVGVRVDLEHLAPAPQGAGLVCVLRLEAWDGRNARWAFSVRRDDGVLLAQGHHWRVAVRPERVLHKARPDSPQDAGRRQE